VILVAGLCLAGPDAPPAPTVSAAQETRVIQLDAKFDPTTYVNRSTPLIIAVNIFLLQGSEKSAYLPVEVGIGNSASSPISLSREGITLIDESGASHPLVSAKELTDKYSRLAYDHERAKTPHLLGPVFAGYRPVKARFSPAPQPGSLVYDRIDLAGNDVLVDILYFEAPPGGVKGKTFELRVEATGLTQPASVRFRVD
jgi:hypothetical protein